MEKSGNFDFLGVAEILKFKSEIPAHGKIKLSLNQ